MSVTEPAKAIYESEFRESMEREDWGKFIAIEPDSRRYYVGDTFMDVALQAKNKIPNKMSFVIKIGSDAAVHIGGAQKKPGRKSFRLL